MAYTPQTWHDEPTEDTPISAARLTVIENGISATATVADAASTTAAAAQSTANSAQSTANAAAVKASNLSDLTSASSARTNLGLGTAAVTNTGTGSTNTILGNDSRLTDARTPTAHASTHASGGGDFIDPTEQQNTVATGGSTQTIPAVTTATISYITLTANLTLTFPTAAAGRSFTIVLKQDSTARTVTWPGTVQWPSGTAPTLTATSGKRDMFTFVCVDGTNWLGTTAGLNF